MTLTNPPKEEDLFRYEGTDGYEAGGLVYFRFAGKEMVALIRERSLFEKYRSDGSTLAAYVNSEVSPQVNGAGLVLEKKIPGRHAFGVEVNPMSNHVDEAIACGERATSLLTKLGHRVAITAGEHLDIDGESWSVRDVPQKAQREHPDEWAAAEQEYRRKLGAEE